MSPTLWLGAAAVLALVVAVEIAAPTADEVALSPPPHAAAVHRRAAPAPAGEQGQKWLSTALARPLFAPDRRPLRQVGGSAVAAEHSAVLPRLAGIIIDPAGGVAIFAAASAGEKPLAVGKGGKLSAWTVLDIAPREVRVRGPGGESTLHVAFDLAANPAAGPAIGALSPLPGNRPFNLHPIQSRHGNEAE
jgi:hypothetical protein